MVGDDVVITVLEIRGEVIRLGISAPRSVQVHREEIYRELQAANREAASPSDTAVEALTDLLAARAGAGASVPASATVPAGGSVGAAEVREPGGSGEQPDYSG
jgi:carbon storage regulator